MTENTLTGKLTNTNPHKPRFVWLDWMKVLGIYLIIVGHFDAQSHEVVYVYSVPLFFIISGFLSHKMANQLFRRKIVRNLIIPLLIIAPTYLTLCSLPSILVGKMSALDFGLSLLLLFVGDGKSLGPCWFIYTLIILKCIHQFMRNRLSIAFSILCLIVAACYAQSSLHTQNAIVNVVLSYPVFLIGVKLRRYKSWINDFNNKAGLVLIAILSLMGVLLCVKYNGIPWMYINYCGGNILLFLLGSICGTIMIFAISKLLGRIDFNGRVQTISDGTIIILGYHLIAVIYISLAFNLLNIGGGKLLLSYILSVAVLSLFYPLIVFTKQYIPILLGDRKRVE